MSKKIGIEAEEFNALKKIGFEFDPPQDEYSYQPESSGSASGEIGKQEYGIDVDLESPNSQKMVSNELEDYSSPVLGESEWSQKNRIPLDELQNEFNAESDDILYLLIQKSLDQNPQLDDLNISIEVENGNVNLFGEVANDAIKLLISDIIEDLSGVNTLNNSLKIQ